MADDLKIVKVQGAFCVYKGDKKVKCHAEESQAMAQLKLMKKQLAAEWEAAMATVMSAARGKGPV